MVGNLLVARLLVGQQPQRVEEGAVGQHLVVQVVARGAAGAADAPDDVAALHLVVLADRERQQVAVAGFETVAVAR